MQKRNALHLRQLLDVETTTDPVDGAYLKYDGERGRWVGSEIPLAPDALEDFDDVDFDPAPTDGQVLKYNATTQKWEPYTIPAPNIPDTLDDLTDVDAASPSTGDLLQWDGTSWVPYTPVSSAIPDPQYVDVVSGVGINRNSAGGPLLSTGIQLDLQPGIWLIRYDLVIYDPADPEQLLTGVIYRDVGTEESGPDMYPSAPTVNDKFYGGATVVATVPPSSAGIELGLRYLISGGDPRSPTLYPGTRVTATWVKSSD